MTDEDQAPKAIEPISDGGDKPPPPLAIHRDGMTFVGAEKMARLCLDTIIEVAALPAEKGGTPIPALLYAIALKLHDVDRSLRAGLEISQAQEQRVSAGPASPGAVVEELVEPILKTMREMGFPMPAPTGTDPGAANGGGS